MTQALTPDDVATELSIPRSTARAWMLEMPGVFKVGRHVRIGRLDFERWIQRRKDEQAYRSGGMPPRREVRLTFPRTKPRETVDTSVAARIRPIVPRTKLRLPEP